MIDNFVNKTINDQNKKTKIIVLISALGILLVIGLAAVLPFKDQLLSRLYPKPSSFASETQPPISGPEASLSLLAPASTAPGQEIRVSIWARSDIDAANLFVSKLKFPTDLLEVSSIDVTTGPTFVKNWIEKTFDNTAGTISLSGGVPNPGYKTTIGQPSGLMAEVVFKTKKAGSAIIDFDSESAIYRDSDNVNVLTTKRPTGFKIESEVPPPITPTPTGRLSPTPIPPMSLNGKGSFDLNIGQYSLPIDGVISIDQPNRRINLTCKLGALNCHFTAIYSARNRTGKNLYYPTIWVSNLGSTSMLKYVNFSGQLTSDRSTITDNRIIEPGQEVINTYFSITPPSAIGTYLSTMYIDAKTCNLATNPPNCIYYGGSDISVKVNVVDSIISPTPTPTERSIELVAPNGGEQLAVGQTYRIRWNSTNIDKVTIGYSTGPGSLNPIANANLIANQGYYDWVVNVGNTTNTKFKIDILGYQTGKGSVTDQSNDFFTVTKGDVNGDGKITLVDMSALLSRWGKKDAEAGKADINLDGVVNTFDYEMMRTILVQNRVIKGAKDLPANLKP